MLYKLAYEALVAMSFKKNLKAKIKRRGINTATLEQVLLLTLEIAKPGRDGRKAGALFTVFNSKEKRIMSLL